MTTGGPPAIALRDVRKTFRSGGSDVHAVDGVTLEIADGEFFCLLGPSGSGKTTLLRMIAGFELPTDGTIELQGSDVTRLAPFERDVNTVFQDYALFPHMTVSENVAYGLKVKRVARAERARRVAEALDTVRLADLGARKPSQLSGGQRQRIALARALVNRPKVLLLDEPLGALDLKLRQQMQVELKAIQHEVGITFILVTHDQEEALTMSDRIAVFNGGRIEQVGTPMDVYERPATPFVAGFVGASNVLEGAAAAALLGSPGPFTIRPEKIRLRTYDRRADDLRTDDSTTDDSTTPGEVSCAGVIASVEYLGPLSRYRVSLAVGGELSVVTQNAESVERLPLRTVGSAVRVTVRRSEVLALGPALPVSTR